MCSRRQLRALLLALGGAGFVFAGCGKKGDPFPPPSKVSAPIQNLQARQVGNELQLRMSYPTTTLSGLPLEGIESLEVWSTFIPVVLRTDVALDESGDEVEAVDEETAPVEIPDEEVVSDDQDEDEDTADEREADDRDEGRRRAGSREAADDDPLPPLDTPVFASIAEQQLEVAGEQLADLVQGTEIVLRIALPEPPPIEEPEADTEDDDIEAEELRPDDGAQTVMMAVLGVRTRAPKRKASPFSNLVRMVFEEPPPTPTGLVLEAGQDGIRLAWQAPEEGRRFNVYRRRPGAVDFGQPIALIRSSELHSHLDDTAIFGRRYEYGVTAVATGIPPVQSEVSDTAELEYLDTFAPSAPQDVVALIEGGRIRLLWSPVSANDLLGYRIYRSTGGGDSELRTEPPVTTVDWSDEEVAAGVTYIYRVTAVDREGNESDGSEGVTAIAR